MKRRNSVLGIPFANPFTTPFAVTLAVTAVLTGCANTEREALYLAEQGDLDGALAATNSISSLPKRVLLAGGSSCRDQQQAITLQVAQGNFSDAVAACEGYREQCSVAPANGLCFTYDMETLRAAGSDAELASAVIEEAKAGLHFRWLMVRDDYEGRRIKRPLY